MITIIDSAPAEPAQPRKCLLVVFRSPLSPLSSISIHKSNLLETRVVIQTSEPFGWFAPPKIYSGLGADIVIESLHSKPLPGRVNECKRLF